LPDPFTIGAPIAAKAIRPLASALGRKLEGDEQKLVGRSFFKAIKKAGEERQLQTSEEGRLKRAGKKVKASIKNASRSLDPKRRDERREERDLASWIARTWAAADIESTAAKVDREKAPKSASDPGRDAPPPRGWSPAMVYFLTQAAYEGAGNYPGAASADRDPTASKQKEDAWQKRQQAWHRILGVEDPVDEAAAKAWATQVASLVQKAWRANPRLHGLIAQLNFDSQQGLVQAIALSGQDIARSLKRMAAVTLPLGLLGGGGIALLVLFVDKG
jgi:hypothetical protein